MMLTHLSLVVNLLLCVTCCSWKEAGVGEGRKEVSLPYRVQTSSEFLSLTLKRSRSAPISGRGGTNSC